MQQSESKGRVWRRYPPLVVVALLLASACRTAPIHNIVDAPVGGDWTVEDVERAIKIGAARRGWTTEHTGPGHVVAAINVRARHKARVDITYDAKRFSIVYRDSEGLVQKGGQIHRNYNRWVIKLKQAILDELLKAALDGRRSAAGETAARVGLGA